MAARTQGDRKVAMPGVGVGVKVIQSEKPPPVQDKQPPTVRRNPDDPLMRIIMTVPSIADRGTLLSALSVLRHKLKQAEEAQAGAGEVADWLDRHWPENTVRAKAVRRAAALLREHGLTGNPRG